MGMFTSLVLFSEVKGTVLNKGIPVRGAEIIQQTVWSDNRDEIPPRQTTTDAAGAFGFPTLERSAGVTRLVPHQPVVLQKLLIRYEGVEYEAWRHTKNSYDLNSELDGQPLRLVCELTTPPDFEGTHYGICRVG